MEALSKIANQSELLLRPSAELSLARTSATDSLTSEEWDALELLMSETQARYPNQELPPATPAMWVSEWADMVKKFGMSMFRESLSKALRDGRHFFPPPEDIEAWCQSLATDRRNRVEAEKLAKKDAEAKAQWEREQEEDRLHGKPEKTETEKRLDALLEKARTKDRERPYYGPPARVMTLEQVKAAVADELAKGAK